VSYQIGHAITGKRHKKQQSALSLPAKSSLEGLEILSRPDSETPASQTDLTSPFQQGSPLYPEHPCQHQL